jgi:hypothetical protein
VLLLKKRIDPKHVPDLQPLSAYQRAAAFLEVEYQDYLHRDTLSALDFKD